MGLRKIGGDSDVEHEHHSFPETLSDKTKMMAGCLGDQNQTNGIVAASSPYLHLLRANFYRVKINFKASAKLMRIEQPTHQLSSV